MAPKLRETKPSCGFEIGPESPGIFLFEVASPRAVIQQEKLGLILQPAEHADGAMTIDRACAALHKLGDARHAEFVDHVYHVWRSRDRLLEAVPPRVIPAHSHQAHTMRREDLRDSPQDGSRDASAWLAGGGGKHDKRLDLGKHLDQGTFLFWRKENQGRRRALPGIGGTIIRAAKAKLGANCVRFGRESVWDFAKGYLFAAGMMREQFRSMRVVAGKNDFGLVKGRHFRQHIVASPLVHLSEHIAKPAPIFKIMTLHSGRQASWTFGRFAQAHCQRGIA